MTAPRHFHQAVAAAKAGIGKGDSVTRPTADIEADLHEVAVSIVEWSGSRYPDILELHESAARVREAADRLAELDADLLDQARHWRDAFDVIDALRPDCPTCGGTLTVRATTPSPETAGAARCPDCLDGKVGVAQLAATWRAVWDDANPIWRLGEFAHDIRAHLRAAKP